MGCAGDMLPSVEYLMPCATMEVEAACMREQEGSGRRCIALQEEMALRHLASMSEGMKWMIRASQLIMTQPLVSEAEALINEEDASTEALTALTQRITTLRRPPHPMSQNARDHQFGILAPLEKSDIGVTEVQILRRILDFTDDPAAYANLADNMKEGDVMKMPNGEIWERERIFIYAQARAPNCWKIAVLFAYSVPEKHIVTLEDGTQRSKIELIQQVSDLRPNISLIYNKLGHYMKGPTMMVHGVEMTRVELYKRSIALDPDLLQAYTDLGAILPPGGRVTLQDGRTFNKVQLYQESIHMATTHNIPDPAIAHTYSNLANCLPTGGSTMLRDGTVMTQEELYKKAISIHPDFSNAYNNLGTCIPYGGTTRLENGTVMTKEEVFRKAVELNPNNSCAEENLSDCERYAEYKRLSTGSSSGFVSCQSCGAVSCG